MCWRICSIWVEVPAELLLLLCWCCTSEGLNNPCSSWPPPLLHSCVFLLTSDWIWPSFGQCRLQKTKGESKDECWLILYQSYQEPHTRTFLCFLTQTYVYSGSKSQVPCGDLFQQTGDFLGSETHGKFFLAFVWCVLSFNGQSLRRVDDRMWLTLTTATAVWWQQCLCKMFRVILSSYLSSEMGTNDKYSGIFHRSH